MSKEMPPAGAYRKCEDTWGDPRAAPVAVRLHRQGRLPLSPRRRGGDDVGVTESEGWAAVSLDDRFEALIFDWDGTAVPDRRADATTLRGRLESCCEAGMHVVIVSGTNVENIDGQLRARPNGPGRLFLCCNRGSEIFEVSRNGPVLRYRRTASPEEDARSTSRPS